MQEKGLLIISSLGLIAVVIATVAYFISQRRLRKRVLIELFQDRQPIDGDQYYQTYFGPSDVPKEIVLTVTQILEDETGLNFSRISPDEPMDGPIASILDGMELVDTVIRLEQTFNIKITDAEAEIAKTPRQVIDLVNAKFNSNI